LKLVTFINASVEYDCTAYNEKVERRKLAASGPGRFGVSIKEDNLSGFDTWQELFNHYHTMDPTYTEKLAKQLFEDSEPQSESQISMGRMGPGRAKLGCGVPTNPMVLQCAGYKNKTRLDTNGDGPGRGGRSNWWDTTWHDVNERRILKEQHCWRDRSRDFRYALVENKECDRRVVTFSVDINELEYQHEYYRQLTKPLSSLKFKPKKICRAIMKALEVWQNAADLEFYEMPFEGQSKTCSRLLSQSITSKFCEDRYVDSALMSKIGNRVAQIRIGFVPSNDYHHVGHTQCNLAITGSTLAHAYFPSMGDIAGDAHFSIDKAWEYKKSTKKYDDVDLFLVMVHELGHSLGLDHSPRADDIMFGVYKYKEWNEKRGQDWWKDILSKHDIWEVEHKYGPQTDHSRKSCFSKAKPPRKINKGNVKKPVTKKLHPRRKPAAKKRASSSETWKIPSDCTVWYYSETTDLYYKPKSCTNSEQLEQSEVLLGNSFCILHCKTNKCEFKTEPKRDSKYPTGPPMFNSKSLRCWN
jgi:hypothetical protein